MFRLLLAPLASTAVPMPELNALPQKTFQIVSCQKNSHGPLLPSLLLPLEREEVDLCLLVLDSGGP